MNTLLLAACGSGSVSSTDPLNSKPVAANNGPLAPDFTISTGEGTTFSLSGHQGDIVVLYFSFPG